MTRKCNKCFISSGFHWYNLMDTSVWYYIPFHKNIIKIFVCTVYHRQSLLSHIMYLSAFHTIDSKCCGHIKIQMLQTKDWEDISGENHLECALREFETKTNTVLQFCHSQYTPHSHLYAKQLNRIGCRHSVPRFTIHFIGSTCRIFERRIFYPYIMENISSCFYFMTILVSFIPLLSTLKNDLKMQKKTTTTNERTGNETNDKKQLQFELAFTFSFILPYAPQEKLFAIQLAANKRGAKILKPFHFGDVISAKWEIFLSISHKYNTITLECIHFSILFRDFMYGKC